MIGIDEVGRGAWAGPLLVVAARQTGQLPADLTDSKLLKRLRRLEMLSELRKSCKFGEGWVTAVEIDQVGLAIALRLGISRALLSLKAGRADEIVFDGAVNYVEAIYKKARCQIKADLQIPVVSAASVYAKVRRDQHMVEVGKQYPVYGFDTNVGYGTKTHRAALLKFGTLKGIHRLSFSPLNSLSGVIR